MIKPVDELERLVPLAAAGNPRALQRVIGLIHPPVVRYCRARIGASSHPGADDVAQETSFAVAQAIKGYEDQGRPFMAFVYGIAAHKVADARRSLARDRLTPTEEVPDIRVDDESPEHFALVSDGSNRVITLLDSLSERAREIITLRVFVGMSAEETGEIIGISAGAVRVAQHRALATLRKRFEEGTDGQST